MNATRTAALSLDGFGVAFGKRVVLDGITLTLPPDGIDVLMGPVKSGKSSLFRTLSGLYEGHALQKSWGSASYADQPVTTNHRPPLVQQHAKIFEQSLLDTLLQPVRATQQKSPAEWRVQGLAWLAEYGLNDAVTLYNQPLIHCSTRIQRSVLILAQALVHPPMLMIDEPTYGLDEAEATKLIDWLKKISLNCKLFISLHNQAQARRLADRIVLIGGGRVLAHQETLAFFQRPANEWVEQFIRTGSLALPSPDAKAHDLECVTHTPPPLSDAGMAAITPEKQAAPVMEAAELESHVAEPEIVEPVARPAEVKADPVVLTQPVAEIAQIQPPVSETVARVQLPPPSRDGVELASMVGNVMLRDAAAPRGFNWIIPGKLAGCPAPGIVASIDYDLDLLSRVGITRLITLTEKDLDQDALQRHKLTNTHLPIFDREAPSIGQTHMLLVRMQKYIAAGDVLAVHCKAGLGRTGTILAAWLIRDGGLSAEGAMARLRRIEPGFIQSAVQEEFLHLYEADITSRML